ncbi:hypothetical protein [Xanthomonas vasicola]|uniref:hypothetical protein n=1 Tax=Xanthomonas vasicola TaxID=56459 RepID=UPI000531AF6A|nr:hypothetical protein [Xanthomonas vasicola]AZR34723.1 hypothetical protein NX08_009790 [Xanthomonas vasicola]KGR49387.1 hypothetical protein NX07_18875 [Xanthomonas vasicola]KGR51824.1 hypothetical protein NX09_17890 [Xanthomonas vasicola]KGT84704.1 hypothetical protein OC00_06870 [Xanthomonas vasicola]
MSPRIASLVLASGLAAVGAIDATEAPRPSGISIVDRDVIPATQVTPPCVSLAAAQTSVSIPTAYLEDLANQAQGDMQNSNDPARVAYWKGRSARWLLDLAGTVRDAKGCDSSPIAHAHRSSQRLAVTLLESGIAAVWVHDQPGFVSRLRARDYNRDCARGPLGSSSYRVANGPAVMLLVTCMR